MGLCKNDIKKQKQERLGLEKLNNQGCLMKIIEYNSEKNIVVEFQDEYKTKIKTRFSCFNDGEVKNPYFPSVYKIGIIGAKYNATYVDNNGNRKIIKEYDVWHSMLKRCYSDNNKRSRAYKDVVVCKEWFLYENFYEWLHSQDNFDKWLNGYRWAIDKDILVKGNKIYSPNTCCLVPNVINALFIKQKNNRGNCLIGVIYHKRDKIYEACCSNIIGIPQYLGRYKTQEEAFCVYKEYKERIIKQVAQEEYSKGTITKKCYDAMINYKVEITD